MREKGFCIKYSKYYYLFMECCKFQSNIFFKTGVRTATCGNERSTQRNDTLWDISRFCETRWEIFVHVTQSSSSWLKYHPLQTLSLFHRTGGLDVLFLGITVCSPFLCHAYFFYFIWNSWIINITFFLDVFWLYIWAKP